MASLIKRGKYYHIQYCIGGKAKRKSLGTTNKQLAKEKLRQFESAKLRGQNNPLPTRTSIADILGKYVEHIRTVKTPKSAQTDVYYLREAFGAICPAVAVNSRRQSAKARKRPPKPGQDRRCRRFVIESDCFENITTADIAECIHSKVRSRGLAPKTANRFREILTRLFNWAMKQAGVRMPDNTNPAAAVERYREKAPQISFLTLSQIDEQLSALSERTQLQTMVAMYIYAGLRREEALWLQPEDIDLKTGMIRIRAKEVSGQKWQPKTGINRAVPISKVLRHYLTQYAPKPSSGGWFFPSPKGARYDPDNFSRDLRKAQKETNLS